MTAGTRDAEERQSRHFVEQIDHWLGVMNLSGLVGYTGSHVLGNFSVSKMRGEAGTGFSAKLKDLTEGIKAYQVVLESDGKVIPGGRAPFAMAAKGLWDSEYT